MGSPEHYVEGYLVKECKARGWWIAKFTSPGLSGVPDQCLVTPALTCFVEVKREGGKLRRLQMQVIAKMRRAGATVFVADSREKVDEIIVHLEKLQERNT